MSSPTLVKIFSLSTAAAAAHESTRLLAGGVTVLVGFSRRQLACDRVVTDDCAGRPGPGALRSAERRAITAAAFGNNASSVAISGDVSANKSVGLELALSGLQLGFVNADLQGES
jgi:hypothetical protein